MNNRIIKTFLLLLVIGGIAVAIVFTQKSIDQFTANQKANPFDFAKYVEHMVDSTIVGSASHARAQYENIYDIITTENSIRSNRGRVVTQDSVNDCYVYAFAAYWRVDLSELQDYFYTTRREWSKSKRDELNSELSFLKNREGNAVAIDTIKLYQDYLKQYQNALNLISRSKQTKYVYDCKSYEKICDDCKKYQKFPYTNSSKLKEDLADVPSNAKKAWKKYVIEQISSLVTDEKFKNDDDKGNFTSEYNSIKSKKDEFTKKFSSDTEINAAMAALNSKSSEWTEYFKQKKKLEQQIYY